MLRILIAEDEEPIANLIRINLTRAGYQCTWAPDGQTAADLMEREKFDLALLDIMLPGINGYELMDYAKACELPVIFLTANDTESQMIAGFQHGCDDYIAKPFSIELLYQRILAVLRRSQSAASGDVFSYLTLTVDFVKMQVQKENAPVKLSAMEYKLLELLIRNRGQVLTRDLILERLWDCDGNFVDENTLRVLIRRLRQKIETDPKNPKLIVTVFGIGYTFGESQ